MGVFGMDTNVRGERAFQKTIGSIRVNKIAGNTLRDRSDLKKLATKGWASLVIWECHVGNAAKLETKVREFLRGA